jgi:hypothetical protein
VPGTPTAVSTTILGSKSQGFAERERIARKCTNEILLSRCVDGRRTAAK